jgi:hypothetical protein
MPDRLKSRFFLSLLKALCLLVILSPSKSFSQEDEKSFLDEFSLHGYYIGTSLQVGNLESNTIYDLNFIGGICLNPKWRIGLAYQNQLNEPMLFESFSPHRQESQRLGLELRYILFPDRMIHLNIPVGFGMGELELHRPNTESSDFYVEDNYFFTTAGLEAEIKLNDRFRATAGAVYRHHFGLSLPESVPRLSEEQLNGIFGVLGIQFGLY